MPSLPGRAPCRDLLAPQGARTVPTRLKRVTFEPEESPRRTYSYLGPAGTFTEAALAQVPEARGQHWRPVHNVGEALADVVEGRSDAAMIAIENSVDGGVSTAQDALATMPGIRIVGEYLVPVDFVLVARPARRLRMCRWSPRIPSPTRSACSGSPPRFRRTRTSPGAGASVGGRHHEIALDVSRVVRPVDGGSGDQRELGLQVSGMRLRR